MFLKFFQPQLFYCADIVKYGSRTAVDQFDYLILNEMESDVTLVVGEIELPAHRSILSEQSEYFRAMFSLNFMESNSDKIILKDISLNAFKHVLKCIYAGSMNHYNDLLSIDEDFEVLQCAIYFAVEVMTSPMMTKLKKLNRNYLLTKALAYSIEELISRATDRILRMIPELRPENKNKWIFYHLSPLAVEHLLKQTLDASASAIFKGLGRWMHKHPSHSHVFPQLLELVELHLLDDTHWNMLFEPKELIDRNFCQTLLNEQRILAQRVQKVVDQNVIKSANDIRIVDGRRARRIGIFSSLLGQNRSIMIDLKQLFLLNCLKFELMGIVGYIISVSKDMREWQRVVNHYGYSCYGKQILLFDERVIRFVRIQFQDSSILPLNSPKIEVGNVEALYSTVPYEFDVKTTLIVPTHNLIHMKMLWDWDTAGGYKSCDFTNDHVHSEVGLHILYQFSQPYIIGSLKLLLKEVSSFYVEIATKKEEWTRVLAEEDAIGWRVATFEEQPVLFIKIVGTKAPKDTFHLYEFVCPAV